MDPKVAILGLACIGALLATTRVTSAHMLAWGMAAVWCEANMLWLANALEWLPLIDVPIALAGAIVWQTGPTPARRWFSGLYGLRLPLHVLAASGGVSYVLYAHALNALFFAALVALSWEGGVGDAIGNCLRRLRGPRLFVAASACFRASDS